MAGSFFSFLFLKSDKNISDLDCIIILLKQDISRQEAVTIGNKEQGPLQLLLEFFYFFFMTYSVE